MTVALFFNVPGHGHINPTLPLVAELARRGHRVTYYATEGFRVPIEASGAAFQPYASIPDDYFEAHGLHGGVPNKVAHDLMHTTAEILPDLLSSARAARPDYVLHDSMCPWGYYTSRVLGVPGVVSYALMPPITPPLRALPRVLRDFLPALLRDRDKGADALRTAQALGKQYGVPPLGRITMMSAPGEMGIAHTSRAYQPFASTVPASVTFIGWTLREAPAGESIDLSRAQGKRLVYVSLGTVNNDQPQFFRACIEAFGGGTEFVLVSTGRRIDPEAFGALPGNIAIERWVPQSEVLKHAALFVSHGGLNSIHDGLYCGVPLLLVPQQGEQTFNAGRVVELGAGLMLKRGQVSAESLRLAAAQLLAEPRFAEAARRIGETLRTAGGPALAAEKIEELLARSRNKS